MLDLVCPVYAGAFAHFEILLASWRRYWRIPGTLRVYAPDTDLPLFAELLRDEPHIALESKRALIGNAVYDSIRPLTGWYRQQMVKLGACRAVHTPLYMAIDADCFCARTLTRVEDLLRLDLTHGARIPWAMKDAPLEGSRLRYYLDTAMTLGLDNRQMPSHSVFWRPPFIFHTATMKAGLAHTEDTFNCDWRDILRVTPMWTEPSYYHLAARLAGTWNTLHTETPEAQSRTHEVITYPAAGGAAQIETEFTTWDPADTFNGHYNFGVVHSHTKIDPKRTHAKLLAAGKL